MNVEFVETEKLTGVQKESIQKLRAAVYPPEVLATLPGRLFTWAAPQWSVLIWDGDELIAKVGMLARDAFHDNAPRRIGGIRRRDDTPCKTGTGIGKPGDA